MPFDEFKSTLQPAPRTGISLRALYYKHYVWPLISIATDNVNSDTPAISKLLYICTEFVGTESLLTDVYDMKMGRLWWICWKMLSCRVFHLLNSLGIMHRWN